MYTIPPPVRCSCRPGVIFVNRNSRSLQSFCLQTVGKKCFTMLSFTLPLRFLPLALILACPAPTFARTNDTACSIAERLVRTHTVREQAVSINTDVLTNTTFYAIPDVAITVTNAPTSFNTVTTLHWTEEILPQSRLDTRISPRIVRSSTDASFPAPYAVPTVLAADSYYVMFAMGAIAGAGRKALGKRQSISSTVGSRQKL